MLLDRKRIDRWAKFVAAGMALIFGLSFVFLGVGSGLGGLSDLWSSVFGGNKTASSGGATDQIKTYEATLAKNPKDLSALLALATQYEQLNAPAKAAPYLERASEVAPTRSDIQLRLATLYLSDGVRDYASAARVLNKATSLEPSNADAFLRLGVAERGAGNAKAAILAWNRYLQLAPDGDMATTIRSELAQLTGSTETTATAGNTSTTAKTTTTTK